MKKVTIGIIGAGGISDIFHLPAFQKMADELDVVAISDVDNKKLTTVAEKFSIPKRFNDYTELLKEDIDAVVVCLPNYLHAPVSIKAMKMGKHVLCEKPVAVNAVEAKRMLEASEKLNKVLMVGFQMKFQHNTNRLKKYVAEGGLGNVYLSKAIYLRRRGIPLGWFGKKKYSGGGALIDIGVHVIDAILYILDYPAPVKAYGVTYRKFSKSPGKYFASLDNIAKQAADVEDYAMGLVTFNNGMTMHLETSWASYIEEDHRIDLEIMGDAGGAKLNPLHIATEQSGDEVNITQLYEPTNDPFVLQGKHFVECIRMGKKPISSAENGLMVMKIIEAIYKSARLGRCVTIA